MLTATILIPLIVAVALGANVTRLSGALRPSLAVRMLAMGGVLVAMGTGISLSVVAMCLLARASRVAALGHWSRHALPNPWDLPWPVGVPVAVVVGALLLAAAVHTTRAGIRLRVANALCRRLGPTLDDHRTVVIEQDEPDAYAVAGLRGRIVISTAMLAALSEPERRVLLAHERAHLVHHHHLWIQLSEIAAAANPLLRRLPAAVRLAAERWADEDAADEVGDRRVAAGAIAHAALARHRQRATSAGTTALAATGGDVPRRVQALLQPPQLRFSGILEATLVLMFTAVLTASAVTAHNTEQQFEYAQVLHTASPAPLR